jgi:shikimate 5-dehydrogenase
VILGGGGSARAVAHALRAASVDVFAREPQRVAWTRARRWTADDLRAAFARADLVVDTTPIGLAELPSQCEFVGQLPLDALSSSAWVATLVYHTKTELLQRAASLGHSTVDGRAMLIHQAAAAYEIWTRTRASIDAMSRAFDDVAGT